MNKFRTVKMFSILLIIAIIGLSATNCSRENRTLAELGDEKITLGEFEKQYLKTVGNIDTAKNKPLEDKQQFLNLYVNFRLKVKDARERGLLNNPEIQKDIEEYKRNYSPTYLVDKEIVESEVKKLYDMKKDEVRASHILIQMPENASPEDSAAAYQKADTIIQKLEDGANFEDLAVEYSQDRTVRTNRGDLYYFTGGMTVPEFEDAVYDMRVGQFTKKPVRTMFGLHIVKLTDRKGRIESVRISHILIQDKRDSLGNIIDSVETYQKTLDIYNRAKGGESFEELANQFTEDQGSKNQMGDIGYMERRRLAQPLDSVAFNTKVGDISGPIRTPYGWHIIKKTDEKPLASFEKQFENLKNEYKKTQKYKEDYAKFVETLKEKYSYKILDEGMGFLQSKFDTSKTIADYNLDSLFSQADKEVKLAAYDGGDIKIIDIINHMNINRDYQRMALNKETIIKIINSSAENSLLNKRADDLGIEDDEEYIANLTDYENGLLVFRIDQDELWSKVKVNENDLVSYYEANRSKFTKVDSTGNSIPKTFDEVRAEISNELQQIKYKDTEKAYLESLRQKYPVKIYDEVLAEAFKE
ncbi:MAG: peptidyl-prolyl cis-trans isomerase [Chlorobi bacterium]|nr:peptidyl-prolyl cis-trans isomerase [Chlorobiota bacterium]MCI0714953.1 peptidyl-prolyl cis-trans isomerase [Chlorobiota bacterium]